MSTTESTNVLATAELEPTVVSKDAQPTENDAKTSDAPDASTSASASSAEPLTDPAVEDSSKSSPADDKKVDEVASNDMKTSASVESEISEPEKGTASPAKDDVNEEVVNKGKILFLKILSSCAPYISYLQKRMLLLRRPTPL
jgi:hypothetical protein